MHTVTAQPFTRTFEADRPEYRYPILEQFEDLRAVVFSKVVLCRVYLVH